MGASGLLMLKLIVMLFDSYVVLFCGLETVIMGGIVPGIGGTDLKMKKAFAFAKLTNCTPINAENMRTDINAVVNIVVLFIHHFPSYSGKFLFPLSKTFQ